MSSPPVFAPIFGQARALGWLSSALAHQKVPHALLFDGPPGVGKATTALALAQALNCESGGCGKCDSCRVIGERNHPDVIFVDMTPKGLTERMRNLTASFAFRPHQGRARVLILDPADDLVGRAAPGAPARAEAANVLLKTLEEPPADTHFILVTAEPRRLPVTVRSRCQRVFFAPLGDGDLLRALDGRKVDRALAERVVAQAQGSLGRSLALVEGADDFAELDEAARALLSLKSIDEVFELASSFSDRERAKELVEQLIARLHLSLKADATSKHLRRIERARGLLSALEQNVSPTLALEHFMLERA